MKFYLDNTEDIFLYQLLKAAGMFEEYAHIRRVVNDGQVTVNERTVFKQRTKLYPGDEVRYKEMHVKILAGKEQRQQMREEARKENIVHGKTANWQAKPLKKVLELEENLQHTAKQLHNLLLKKKIRLSLAESCSGGMASENITRNSGASAYFLGSLVSYNNSAKSDILQVDKRILDKDGAVSKKTAEEMAKGAALLFGSELTGAVTGIAGPGGGSRKKTVGCVFIAVKLKENIKVQQFQFEGNRQQVRMKSCLELFRMMLDIMASSIT